MNPLELTRNELPHVWARIRDDILATDTKLSPVAAGCYATARILNTVRQATSTFQTDIDSRCRSGKEITVEEEVLYDRINDGEFAFQSELARLSGYRPYPLLDEHPLSQGPL